MSDIAKESVEAVAWQCRDALHPFVNGIVTTEKSTVDAWLESGIEFVPLYPTASPEPPNGLPTLDEYRNNLVEECAQIAESSAVTSNGTKIGIGIASKIRALAIAAPAQSNGDEGRGLPLCCVTGRIAGDGFACGDCDPCGAAHAVPQSVKTLLEERDHFADKYSEAACECDTLRARLAKATTALRESLTENAWNAYYCGVTKEGGKWMDGGCSEGEWLRRELGLSDGWHDCAMIQNRIPEVVEKQIAALKDIQS